MGPTPSLCIDTRTSLDVAPFRHRTSRHVLTQRDHHRAGRLRLVCFAHPNVGAQTMSEHVEATGESRDGRATFVVTERIRPTHVQAFED